MGCTGSGSLSSSSVILGDLDALCVSCGSGGSATSSSGVIFSSMDALYTSGGFGGSFARRFLDLSPFSSCATDVAVAIACFFVSAMATL